MKLKKRTPEQFLAGVDQPSVNNTNDLSSLSLEELADQATSIINQSKQMLAKILLEGRKKCKSNKHYGQWVSSIIGLSDITFQHRNAMLNWARFEESHPMLGISMTAGFEIAAPGNAEVAEKVYEYCYNKNLSVEEVKRYIMQIKSIDSISTQDNTEYKDSNQEQIIDIDDKCENFINKICHELNMSDEAVIRILHRIIEKRQHKLHIHENHN